MRSPPVDLERISASPIVEPPGFAQSSGTLSVAHCQSLLGAAESAVALQPPQSSFCAVSDAGSAVVADVEEEDESAVDGLASPAPAPSLPSSDEPLLQCGRQQCGGGHQGRPPCESRHVHSPSQAVRVTPRMAVRP